MPLEVYDHTKSKWAVAAERWLRQALSDVISGYDALPAVSAAEACLKIEAHEQEPDEDLLDAPEEPEGP